MRTEEIIENKLEEFGVENINASTVVCVNKEDSEDVSVFNSEFNTFTKAHAILAEYLLSYHSHLEKMVIDSDAIARFVSDEVE
jgi:hypothetical protein